MELWRAIALMQALRSDVFPNDDAATWRSVMDQYVGLDVSLEQTSICVVDSDGKALWQGKCASTPEALAGVIRTRAPGVIRIGLESGPLSSWHWHELKKLGLPVVCLDARHAKAALSLQLNKTDQNDARGLAQIVRTGWYRSRPSRWWK